VLSKVQQDVDEAVARLARGGEGAGVVTAVPQVTAATQGPVDDPSRTPCEALETTTQGLPGRSLHDEMKVIDLNGEMDHSKVATVGGGQRRTHG
jgi:hypothetical protein